MRTTSNRLLLLTVGAFLLAATDTCDGGVGSKPCQDVPAEDGYRGAPDPASDNIAEATAIAHRYIEEHPVEEAELRWEWTEAVLMHGMVELHRVTGDEQLLAYYRARMDAHLDQGWQVTWSDHCPMALPALDLTQRTGGRDYREVVAAVVDYVFEEAPRNEHGAITHLGNEIPDIDAVWIDSLFMFGVPLARWAACADDEAALDLLGEQLRVFGDLLEDEDGLLTHAYDWPLEQTPGVFWGRGNSWVTAAMAEYLRVRALWGETDDDVQALLERQVAALTPLQHPQTGLWWTVLNRPGETYLETSASALFAYGMARAWRYGWLDDSVLETIFAAVEGVRSRIRDDDQGRPYVTGISGPTGVETFEGYATVDLLDDETYGVGAVLLLLVETSGLESPCEGTCLPPRQHPSLVVDAETGCEAFAERAEREPYATILEAIQGRTDEGLQVEEAGKPWDPRVWSRNGNRALAAAFEACVFEDEEAAQTARELLLALEPRFDETDFWDANIRMTGVSMNYTDAWDLAMATDILTPEEGAEVARVITTINEQLYDRFVRQPRGRNTTCYIAQNNQCIREAASIGYVALAFPEHPQAKEWLDFAVSEMAYLYGPDGHYLQADGGVSEGPFYYQYGVSAAVQFLIRYHEMYPEGRFHAWNCLDRIDIPPWDDHGCEPGEAFVYESQLTDPRFLAAADWAVALRMPDGMLPPIEDGRYRTLNGPALLGAFGGGPHLAWAWYETLPAPMDTARGHNLPVYYYVHFDESVVPEPPPWRNRFFPDVGQAVFRSDHGPAARWLLLLAEEGPTRKTLHDHVDGTSFSMAAYGDYLLIDSGYHNPDPLLNAMTVAAASHNLILIDGEALEKGEFHDWQGADAYLRHTLDGEDVAWAEAHQTYLETDIERGIGFVRGRYFVVADHLETRVTEDREFRWRAHLGVDRDPEVNEQLGGTFELAGQRLQVEANSGGAAVWIASTEGPVAFEEPAYTPERLPHVHNLDQGVGEHAVADGVITGRSPDFLTVLAPYALEAEPGSADAELTVTAVDAGDAAVAWLVETVEGTDLAWLRGADAAATLRLHDGTEVETDARVVIVALDGSFALLTRGSTVTLDGEAVIDGEIADVTDGQ